MWWWNKIDARAHNLNCKVKLSNRNCKKATLFKRISDRFFHSSNLFFIYFTVDIFVQRIRSLIAHHNAINKCIYISIHEIVLHRRQSFSSQSIKSTNEKTKHLNRQPVLGERKKLSIGKHTKARPSSKNQTVSETLDFNVWIHKNL